MDVDDIERIAVLGAGSMGHGIAEVAAIAGFEVALRDIEDDIVQDGYDRIEWSLGKLAERDQLTEDEADAAIDRVTPLVDLETAVEDADVVIEAVPERMDVKRDVYADVSAHAPEPAVFASNTSSLSITELAEATDRPERFCGMHFFNPPVRMALVEVIAGEHTDDDTLRLVEALADAMGKTPVRVRKDSPGFIVNRVLVPLLNEAAWIVHDGDADIEVVDSTATHGLGLPMGAFELADQVGIDVAVDVLKYMHAELGAAYAPCPLLEAKLDDGDLGKKTGQGFYDWDDGGADIPAAAADDDIGTRLLAVMANEVAKLVAADVADPDAIDDAVELGAAFPDGPARMADDAGLDVLRDTLHALHDDTGATRYEPADELVARADAGRGFHDTTSDESSTPTYDTLTVTVDGRVGRIELDRPHRMNTITPDLLHELEAAVDDLESRDGVRALLVTGAGDRAFCAGADVNAFSVGSPLDAVELSRTTQRAFGRLESCGLPVVAGIDGYCLGGGMELATCCDLRVASERAEFGQPELDLGLVPGGGATQRLRHVVGEGRAREIILTADRYDADTMRDYGFVNDVVPADDLADQALAVAEDLAAGPPIAQRLAKRAILEGRGDGDAGLELEAQAFGLLMDTDDVMEGLSAFMADRDPEFTGE